MKLRLSNEQLDAILEVLKASNPDEYMEAIIKIIEDEVYRRFCQGEGYN